MRHTFASLLVALGEDPRFVMDQLGHTDPVFTMRVYTHQMRRREDELMALKVLAGKECLAPLAETLPANVGR